MPRLSIEISEQQHQALKATAALKGQSIKDYVLERTFSDTPDVSSITEDEAMSALAALLKPRIQEAKEGKTVAIPAGELVDHIEQRVAQREQ